MNSLNYFKEKEFTCEGEIVFDKMNELLLQKLDNARGFAGIPFKITSSFRSADHNKKVGGKPNSAHTKGLAVDIACNDSRSRMIIIESLLVAGFDRIGIANDFIHADCDSSLPQNVIWTY